MQKDYQRFYENNNSTYYSAPQPVPQPQPMPRPTGYKRKSYAAHIIIPLILLVFVLVLQLIFGIFDVFLPERADQNSEIKGNKRYVSITLDEVSPTGYRMTSDSTVLGNVYYSFAGGRCIFLVLPKSDAKGSSPLRNYKLLGKVQAADDTISDILERISGDLKLTSASLSSSSYPFILSYVTTYVIIDIAIAVLLIITTLVSFIVLVYGITMTITSPSRRRYPQ